MKIEKAIETLEESRPNKIPLRNVEFWHAVQLGIEALKHIQDTREKRLWANIDSLPGETEE